jgi:hypothetical protein
MVDVLVICITQTRNVSTNAKPLPGLYFYPEGDDAPAFIRTASSSREGPWSPMTLVDEWQRRG